MAKMYMLIGIPGSGKSTWAKKKIEQDTMTAWLSTDNYIEWCAFLAGKTYTEVFKDKISEATDHFFEDVRLFTSNSLDVIIDRTNMTVASRKRILDLIPSTYYKEAINFKCDENIIMKRIKSRPGKEIPVAAMVGMVNNYEAPFASEGFDKITEIYT